MRCKRRTPNTVGRSLLLLEQFGMKVGPVTEQISINKDKPSDRVIRPTGQCRWWIARVAMLILVGRFDSLFHSSFIRTYRARAKAPAVIHPCVSRRAKGQD
jgi:hypothetical protein